jgi:hypothetical protein
VAVGGFVALLIVVPAPGAERRGPSGATGPSTVRAPQPGIADALPEAPASLPPARLEEATNGSELAALFEQAPDPREQRDVVLRALEVDVRCGVHLALRYLEEDPPLFFRQGAVDGLEQVANPPLGWDTMQPFEAPVNRQAVDRLEREHRLGTPPSPCR